MKGFLVLCGFVSVAMAGPALLQPTPLPNLRAYASASASSASPQQQLSLLRLLPNAPIGPDGRVLDTLEVREVQDEASRQNIQVQLDNESVRNNLGLGPLVSASSSASASSTLSPARLTADGRLVDTLEVQAQSRQQGIPGASPLLSATRLAQSLASVSPTGATSSSRVQLLDVPEWSAAASVHQQQEAGLNLRQNLLLAEQSARPWSIQPNGLPLLVGSNGQLIASPLLVW